MTITPITCEIYTITGIPALDQVTVILRDFGVAHGQLIVECWGAAWSNTFIGMGDKPTRQFLAGLDSFYLAQKLYPPSRKPSKNHFAYLQRIAKAVIDSVQGENNASPAAE